MYLKLPFITAWIVLMCLICILFLGHSYVKLSLQYTPAPASSAPLVLPKTDREMKPAGTKTFPEIHSEIVVPGEIISLDEILMIEQIQGPVESDGIVDTKFLDRFVLGFDSEKSTEWKDFRSTNVSVELGYKLSDSSKLGIEAQKEFFDKQDAEAYKINPETGEGMNIKYSVQF